VDAFNQAVDLRGSGSQSLMLITFAPAHEEWIIADFGIGKSRNVTDEEFVPRLTEALTVGEAPRPSAVQRVLTKLKEVERFLKKDDAAFLVAEFLSYFER
jgi:hypothetical protein